MTAQISLTESQIMTAMGNVLSGMVPPGVVILQGQQNMVAEPQAGDFIVMTPIRRERIETNVDSSADVLFTGSIAATTLTITSIAYGAVGIGSPVFGVGVVAGTLITALGTGTGGIGTYTVNNAQTVTSETLSAGFQAAVSPTKFTVQLDIHGPNSTDNSQIIATLWRDEYAVDAFAAQHPSIAPLYADERDQLAFINGENQYENRWIIDTTLQVNPSISTGQQYADKLEISGIFEVDSDYPPGG